MFNDGLDRGVKTPKMAARAAIEIKVQRREAASLRMDGWTGYQKFPSMFFVLCACIENLYTNCANYRDVFLVPPPPP